MKTAVQIWDLFIAGKLNTQEVFEEINKSLKTCKNTEKPKLIRLSEKVLDRDIPMQERNTDLEQAFWDSTHKKADE